MTSLLMRLSDNYPGLEQDNSSQDEGDCWLLNEMNMLFSSRVRFTFIDTIELVSESVLNYGINACLSDIAGFDAQKTAIEERIKVALHRFEPRLTCVELNSKGESTTRVVIKISAFCQNNMFNAELVWDKFTGEIYFNE